MLTARSGVERAFLCSVPFFAVIFAGFLLLVILTSFLFMPVVVPVQSNVGFGRNVEGLQDLSVVEAFSSQLLNVLVVLHDIHGGFGGNILYLLTFDGFGECNLDIRVDFIPVFCHQSWY